MDNSEIIASWIGSKIKDIRKEQNLNLSALSEKSGISIAMISKIENGRVYPTLPSLLQLFDALEINLNTFFNDFYINDHFPGFIFKKREDYKHVNKEEDSEGFNYETILSHTIKKSMMEISLLTLSKDSKRKKLTTDGFEYIYLLKGSIDYELESQTFKMETGDSLFFDGRMQHVPHNTANEDSVLLVIYFISAS
ncbi:helix-turn-helix domain-containing protein [Snuella sedimenti]|uniref:Helix-turn-helix transcriptional regulator n=1 Tax=Snuella sedimenti TaxID=2798802 RepID=A0A8J7LYH9_9FLAO|nr:XRE family transcriptional regulator [Snuella sedimenti]MBJ6368396.1 helix-turn-helix transcriptional regulator [Snuella sedimenti]